MKVDFSKSSGSIDVKEEKSPEEPKPSLIANSEFLIGPHGFTLIPKGSLITEGRMLSLSRTVPTNKKLLNWDVFYRKHRADVRFIEVSDNQWKGNDSIDSLAPRIAQAEKTHFTTLTTLNGGLVSLPAIKSLLKQSGASNVSN